MQPDRKKLDLLKQVDAYPAGDDVIGTRAHRCCSTSNGTPGLLRHRPPSSSWSSFARSVSHSLTALPSLDSSDNALSPAHTDSVSLGSRWQTRSLPSRLQRLAGTQPACRAEARRDGPACGNVTRAWCDLLLRCQKRYRPEEAVCGLRAGARSMLQQEGTID